MEQLEYMDTGIEKLFPIGQKLNLRRTSEGDPEYYSTYVKDSVQELVFIDIPTKGRMPAAVKQGQIVELFVIVKDGVWVGEAEVYKLERASNFQGVWVYIPEYMEKVQRREFLRLDIEFPVKIYTKDEDGENIELNSECANISADGIAVKTKKALSRISNRIEFTYKDVSVSANLKFIHVQYDVHDKMYVTGFKFRNIDVKTSETIHKLVIASQIQMRREGLL